MLADAASEGERGTDMARKKKPARKTMGKKKMKKLRGGLDSGDVPDSFQSTRKLLTTIKV